MKLNMSFSIPLQGVTLILFTLNIVGHSPLFIVIFKTVLFGNSFFFLSSINEDSYLMNLLEISSLNHWLVFLVLH